MTYVFGLILMMSLAGADAPQTRWLCAALLGGPEATLDRAKYEAPLRLLKAARRSSRALPPARDFFEKIRRQFTEREAEQRTSLDVVIDDVHDAAPNLAPTDKIFRHHLIRRVSRRVHELLRGPEEAFFRTRVVSGRDQIADFLSAALEGAAVEDAAHAAERDARRRAEVHAFAKNLPIPRPLSRFEKIAVGVGANAALAAGAALTFADPGASSAAALAGVLGWFGFQDKVFDAVSRLRWRLEYFVFNRRRDAIHARYDESLVARSAAHVRSLQNMIAAARAPGPDALTYYSFDVELPLARGAEVTLDAGTIRAGARGAPVAFRDARWATIEFVLSTRNEVPTLMMFARESRNPADVMMNTYMATIDPARHPLGFH